MQNPAEQIPQLEAAIAAQESLRSTLGDAVTDITIGALRAKLEALRAQAGTVPARYAVSPEQWTAQLQRYLPRELADKMRALGRVEGERRQVTVLFADISDFTMLSESLDPEDVANLIDAALKELAEAVYQYEGYIDKFVGDAVMAVFGAPVAHEDDPERALRAALAMREHMGNFNRQWAARVDRPLQLHIGINTGLVMAGNVGSDLRLSYTVMGDTVNTAARLQDAALPGQILVSRNTYRLTREAFGFAALDPIAVRGKQEPLAAYELQRARVLPDKVRGLRELAPAFVGRERELAELQAMTEELALGRGRIITLTGEAGIGKSRLVSEWRDLTSRDIRWLEGRAFAHTVSLSYGPFLDLLRRHIGIRDNETETQTRERIHTMVGQFMPGDGEVPALLASLLALRLAPEESGQLAKYSAQGLRQHLFEVSEALFTQIARQQPTIIVIEDAHWADTTSLEMLEHLAPLTTRLRLSIVIVTRPNTSDALTKLCARLETRFREHYTQIVLAPLSNESGLEMVLQLLSLRELPEPLRWLIVQKAEGNPFFVEEVIRSLIERGALARDESTQRWTVTPLIDTVSVPDTLQGVMMSRLDRLPAETKWLAQQASVIGRVFLYRVLCEMAEQAARVDTDLGQLEREELIRLSARDPEVEYIFRHALTQEAAYESLLAPRRKELHRKVGEAMERIFAGRLGEFNSILGEHFLSGESWEKAVDYLEHAGDAAAQLYAHPEARLHYADALEAVSHLLEAQGDCRRYIDLIIKHVGVSWSAEDFEATHARLAKAESLLEQLPGGVTSRDDQLRLARVHYWLGRIQYLRNQPREAMRYYQEVLATAQSLGEAELLAIPSSFIGQALAVQGRFAQAQSLLEQAVGPLERAENWVEWIRATGFLGACIAAQGDYTRGLGIASSGATRAREMKFLAGIAMSNIYLSVTYLLGGDLARTMEASDQTIEAAELSGDPLLTYFGHALRAWAQGRKGEVDAARAGTAKARELGQRLGGRIVLSDWFLAAGAELDVRAGQYEEAVVNAAHAVQVAQSGDDLFAQGIAHRAWGQALAAQQPAGWEEVDAHMTASMGCFDAGDCRLEAARTHAAWGMISLQRGDEEAAREHFTHASLQFETSGLADELERTRQLPPQDLASLIPSTLDWRRAAASRAARSRTTLRRS